jgi:hypothetical protein
MKQWIAESLARTEQLFPTERLEQSKARVSALWRNQPVPDRYPFTYWPVRCAYYDACQDGAERLRLFFSEFETQGQLKSDFIPQFFGGLRQSTIPNMFGAREVVVDGDYTCEKIIRGPADIARLPDPEILAGSVAQGWLDMNRWVLEETEGRLPISVFDMQGPVDAAAQMWSYDGLFVLAYEDPALFHHLLSKVTDAFILLWKVQKEFAGDLFVGTHLFAHNWVPPDFGASVSADSLVMVSADFFSEFYTPHLQRIADEFGSLCIHSCGNFAGALPALYRTPCLAGVNWSQMSVQQLVEAGADRSRVLVGIGGEVKDAGSTYAILKQHGIRSDLTFGGMPWPATSDGQIKPVGDWSAGERAALHAAEAQVLAASAV